MAARLTALSLNSVRRQILMPSKVNVVKPTVQQRWINIYTESGGISPKPEITRLGFLQAFTIVATFTYIGGLIARTGSYILEEQEIFSKAIWLAD